MPPLRGAMPWADWTLLGVLAGGFAYGVATIAMRERSLPFIILQREESMDFSLHEEKEKEEEKLTFTDARHEFNKILMELMENREAILEKLRLREEKETAEEQAIIDKRKQMIIESIKDAAEKEALRQKIEDEAYAARKEKERAELGAFKKRMEAKRKEEEERLQLLEGEENSARIADEAERQEDMLAMEGQRNLEVQSHSDLDLAGIEADEKTQKELEQRLEREGAKTGEVQISLMWNDRNDLDLHVLCPSGERLHGGNRSSKCGGEIDVDMNVRAESKRPVENAVWAESAPPGVYKAYVHFYKHHSKRRTKKTCRFTVIVNAGGEVKEYTDSLSLGDPIKYIAEFSMPEFNQRAGYEPETSLERVKLDIANASTIEEYQEINLEGIPAGLKLVWEENIERQIEDLVKSAEQEAKEARFEDVKQMIILATSPEDLEELDLTGFDEDETQRLEDLLESNTDYQQTTRYSELMEKITAASRGTDIQGIIISGVNEEQRASLKGFKDEALERFEASSYSESRALIDAASTPEELDEIEFAGISEEQMKNLMEHMQGRFLELQDGESFDDLVKESDIDEDEISLTDEVQEILSDALVDDDNLEDAVDIARELHTVIETETETEIIEESITEESLEVALEEPIPEESLGEALLSGESVEAEVGESNSESFDDLLNELEMGSDIDEDETSVSDVVKELDTVIETETIEESITEVGGSNSESFDDLPNELEIGSDIDEDEISVSDEVEEIVPDDVEPKTPLERVKADIESASTIEEYQNINLEGIPAGLKMVWKENIQKKIEELEEAETETIEESITEVGESNSESFDDLLNELEIGSDIDEDEISVSDEVEEIVPDDVEPKTPLERVKADIESASTIEEYQNINLEGIPAGLKMVWKENIQKKIEELGKTESEIQETSSVPYEDGAEEFDLLPIGSEIKLSTELLEGLDKRLKDQDVERTEWEVSLIWNNKNDLDLHLTTPAGDTINVDTQHSSCGGELVVSMNSNTVSKNPIEHIIWRSKPPSGKYEVNVAHFRKRFGFGTRDPTPFIVVLNRKGSISGWEGEISSTEPIRSVFEFEIH